jgi:hypothetical protein
MMRTVSLPNRARLSTAVYTLGMVGSCELSLGPERDVRLPITEIVAPAEIAADSLLTVRVTVESGGCRRLEELRVTRTASRATIAALGIETDGPGVNCRTAIRHDVREFSLDPPFTDPFTLAARQPGGTETVRVIRVR